MKKILFFISFFLFTTLTAQVTDSTRTQIEKNHIEKQFKILQEQEKEIKLQIYELEQQLKAILSEKLSLQKQYQLKEKELKGLSKKK